MTFIQSSKNQTWLLPPDIRNIISSDHICYLVDSFVDELDFTDFELRYAGAGHPAYHPRILCKILIQAMIDGTRSSRAIARCVRENVVYMYLAEKLMPDFRTISDFRKNNGNLIRDIFKNTIYAAREVGAVGLGQLSIDGSVVKAFASNNSTVTKGELDVIDDYIDQMLKESTNTDELEDKQLQQCRGYDQLGATSKKRVKSIYKKYTNKLHNSEEKRNLQCIKNLKKAKDESSIDNVGKFSLTDPESRFIKNKKGRIELVYNTQLTVDHKKGIIIANDVCQDRNDVHQLKPQLTLVEQYCGQLKENTKICADSGYMSEKNIQLLMQKNLDPYIPERTDKNNIKKVQKYKKEGIIHASFFTYDDKRDVYICPENQILKLYYEFYDKRRLLIRRVYRGINCRGCKSNQQCTNRKDKTRQLKVNCLSNDRKCLKEKMRTVKAQRTFEERKYTVEPAIGNYKQNLKFREFITRGLNSAKNEFNLVCAAINLKKLWLQSNNANN
ncbi:IS1182 family transposase [uncultured Methanolobus sp.]|uniref:IS1182 family transposase n=1 Tax=uncultured Methanolobus sp. TaxID=218300 RepID=UPI0029C95D28|nr:IS1182 family transposase [uncultured Methanolobus sp.]